jgi:DNA-binding transcriptional ArsR family regulator
MSAAKERKARLGAPQGKDGRLLVDPRFIEALSHPIRIQILDRMASQSMSPKGLADLLSWPLSNVSYHVRCLHELGAIKLVDTAQRRGATEHFYSVVPDAFVGGRQWQRVPASLRAAGAGQALDVLSCKAIASLEAGTFTERPGSAIRSELTTLDEDGWFELVAFLHSASQRIEQICRASEERLGEGPGHPILTSIAAFEVAGGDVS